MKILTLKSYQPILSDLKYTYIDQDHSIDFVNRKYNYSYATIMMNYIHIVLDETGKFVYCWGLCSKNNWIYDENLKLKIDSQNDLQVLKKVDPGASFRLHSEFLQTYFNPIENLVCIGNTANDKLVQFAPSSFIGLTNEGEISSLWMILEK